MCLPGELTERSWRLTNLVIEGYRNFAITTAGILVHNKGAMEAPQLRFRADYPFIFMIRDVRTGSVFFFGRVSDLSQESAGPVWQRPCDSPSRTARTLDHCRNSYGPQNGDTRIGPRWFKRSEKSAIPADRRPR